MKQSGTLTQAEFSTDKKISSNARNELIREIDTLNTRGWKIRDIDRVQSQQLADQALQLSIKVDNEQKSYQNGIAQSLTILSYLNFRAINYANALEQAHQAEQLFLSLEQESWLARVYNNLGICYGNMGDHETSMSYLFKQLELSQKVGDREMEGGAYHDLAIAYLDAGQKKESKESFEQSLSIFREIKDPVGIILALSNLSSFYTEVGCFQEAVALVEQAQSLCDEHMLTEFNVWLCSCLAKALAASGAPKEALNYLERGLLHYQDHPDPEILPWLLLQFGEWHIDHGIPQDALPYLFESLEVMDNSQGEDRERLSVHRVLAKAYCSMGDTKEVYQHLERALEIQETTFEEERKQKALSLSILYQTEIARKEAEVALFKNSLLESEIEERKRIEQTLRETQQAAELASRAKGEFLANMSHEIRTPMNGVIGMVSLLQETDLDEDQREFVETIRSSGEHLLHIINEILDFTKIESGGLLIENQAFAFENCISHVFDLLQYRASEKGLVFNYEIHDDVPRYIVGDLTRVRQVLTNLVGNALKFTEAGHVNLAVKSHPVLVNFSSENRHQLHFAISDTGIGISPEKQKILFQPFSQADASINRKYSGTGLGLVISQRLVESMGGHMWLESEEGVGSTFHFTILVGSTISARLPQCSHNTARQELKTVPSELSVLLVEDNVVNQKVALRMLKSLGIDADLATDGHEALKAVSTKKYDMLLMDIHMPIMDGYQTTQKIRKLFRDSEQPIIVAMTASVLASDKQSALDAGMNDFLPKPVKLEDFSRLFNRIL
ncbi:MAG: ATP-binding protein [Chloroflexota bacterium]